MEYVTHGRRLLNSRLSLPLFVPGGSDGLPPIQCAFHVGNEEGAESSGCNASFYLHLQGCYDKVEKLSLWRKGLEVGREAARRV